jgi:hypothetical protein
LGIEAKARISARQTEGSQLPFRLARIMESASHGDTSGKLGAISQTSSNFQTANRRRGEHASE